MEITRKIILDLLPMYMAGEVSQDTRLLVEEYLQTDPELAEIANKLTVELPNDIPVPLTEEHKMETFRKSKWMLGFTIVFISLMMVLALGAVIVMFFLAP